MAKWHYIITCRQRAKIVDNPNRTQNITIEQATKCIENKKCIFPVYRFDTGKPDYIFNILLFIACIALVSIIVTIIIGKDIMLFNFGIYKLASDVVASSGFFITIISFPELKLFITSCLLKFGKTGNILIVVFYSLILPIFMAAILYFFNLGEEFANLLSLICVFISIKNFYH